jgi:hypothetical protein
MTARTRYRVHSSPVGFVHPFIMPSNDFRMSLDSGQKWRVECFVEGYKTEAYTVGLKFTISRPSIEVARESATYAS